MCRLLNTRVRPSISALIRMREYADIHSLFECTPDRLQGEVVEGVRTYPHKP